MKSDCSLLIFLLIADRCRSLALDSFTVISQMLVKAFNTYINIDKKSCPYAIVTLTQTFCTFTDKGAIRAPASEQRRRFGDLPTSSHRKRTPRLRHPMEVQGDVCILCIYSFFHLLIVFIFYWNAKAIEITFFLICLNCIC